MTTSSNFDAGDDGSDSATGMREGVAEKEWEPDTLAGTTREDGEEMLVIKDSTFDEGHIRSTESVVLSEMK